MENGLLLPPSVSIPSPIFIWCPIFCMLQDKCITVAFHSAVNEKIRTHIIYTDGLWLEVLKDDIITQISIVLSGTCGVQVNCYLMWADTVFIRSVWYSNMKYRPTEGVGRGQGSFSILSLAWSRQSAKAILRTYEINLKTYEFFFYCWHTLAFILRRFNSVSAFTLRSFPLNRCACLTIGVYTRILWTKDDEITK